jgi:putative Holliday junction resolvase
LRALGVDFGSKSIGVAVGEVDEAIFRPLPMIPPSGTLSRDAEAIDRIARQEHAEIIVIGIPYFEDEDRMARICQKLAEAIQKRGWQIALVDESLTSFGADQDMLRAGLKGSQRKRRIDGEAACRILERFSHGKSASEDS